VHPERRQARRQLRSGQPLQRGSGPLEPIRRVGTVGRRRGRERAAGERGELKHGVADRTGIGARVARVGLRLGQVAGEQRRQREGEPQANAIRRGLRGQLGERDVQPASRVLVAAQPPLLVGQRDGERQPLARHRGLKRLQQRPAGLRGIARGSLGVGEPPLQPASAFPLGWVVGQQSQRGGVAARRDPGRRRLQLRGRGAEQLDRVFVAGAGGVLDVVGALNRPRAAALERLRRPGVRAESPGGWRCRVDGVANDRVAKSEPARCRGRPNQRGAQQLVERVQHRPLGQLGHRGGQLGLERVAGNGGRVEYQSLVGRERSQLGAQRGRDCRRHRVVDCAGGGLLRGVHARELLQVEGVAAGLRVDGRGRLADELRRLGLAQRRQSQLEYAVFSVRAGERERQAVGQLAFAGRDREQHRRAGRPVQERRDGVERCRVGPVHVVHPDDQPAGQGQPLEQIPQSPVRSVAIARRRLRLSPRERGQHHPERRGIGEPHPGHLVVAHVREMVVEGLGPQRVGQIALELRGARTEHGHAVRRRTRRQMLEQP
jgi:hypothetical protein